MERVMFITFFCPCKKTFHLFYFSSIFHSPSSCRPSPPSFSGNSIITTIHFLAAPSSPHLPATTSCKEFLAVSLINERRHSLMLQSSSQPHLSWEVRVSFSFAGTTRHYRRRRGSTTQSRIRKFDYFLPVSTTQPSAAQQYRTRSAAPSTAVLQILLGATLPAVCRARIQSFLTFSGKGLLLPFFGQHGRLRDGVINGRGVGV